MIAEPSFPPRRLLRSRFVQLGLPPLASLAAHAVVLVAGLSAAGVVFCAPWHVPVEQTLSAERPAPEQFGTISEVTAVIPPRDHGDGAASDAVRAGSYLFPWAGFRPTPPPPKPPPDFDLAGSGAGDLVAPCPVLIGWGPGEGWLTGRPQWWQGAAIVAGAGSPSPLPRTARRPGGPLHFSGADSARSVCFVCDDWVSMFVRFDAVKDGLAREVSDLRPDQSFNLVFMRDGPPLALDDAGLVAADDAGKAAARRFLAGVATVSQTDPIPAMERAFALHPQVICLLTDGDFPDNHAVMRRIRELNPQCRVRIDTVFLCGPNGECENDAPFLLQNIAGDSGGEYRRIEMEE